MTAVKTGRIALSVLAIVLAIIWIFPVYWMANSAFAVSATPW